MAEGRRTFTERIPHGFALLLFLLGCLGGSLAWGGGEDDEVILRMADDFGPSWIGKSVGGKASHGPSRGNAGAQIKPLWLPMCFLFDAAVDSAKANEKLGAMAAAYAACGIVLEPYSFTLKPNYPDDVRAVSAAASVACPLNAIFGTRGAIQLEARSPRLARNMCQNPEASGCSTLCQPLSISIVIPNAGPQIGLHESMHSNCCGPLCVDRGEGAGRMAGPDLELALRERPPRGFHAAKGPILSEGGLSEAGCAALRAGAAVNDGSHWFSPARTLYYAVERDPAKQFNLMAGRSFFEDPRLASIMRGSAMAIRERTIAAKAAAAGDTLSGPLGEDLNRSRLARPSVAPAGSVRARTGAKLGARSRGSFVDGKRKTPPVVVEKARAPSAQDEIGAVKRPITRIAPDVVPEGEEGSGERRKRGASLHQAQDITRKSKESDFEVDGLY